MIEFGKKYRTRDGREVRIYAVDGCGTYPVHGATCDRSGWSCTSWMLDGRFDHCAGQRETDLIEVLPEVTVRKYVFDSNSLVFTADISTFANNCLGAIDITHNGKEITDVKVVK